MQISQKGVTFVAGHEGFVSKTYADPVGVPTIGFGFTNGSAAVRKHLGPIKYGMVISKEEGMKILFAVMNEEYGPATDKGMPLAEQHEFDMGCSGSFNVGPRIFKWKWAQAWRAGDKNLAATRWRVTATTAKGKKLPGLVRRRKEEADLLLNGNYGNGVMPTFTPKKKEEAKPDSTLREYQMKLDKLGYNPGYADGWMGPETEGAVRAFQENDPHLKNDGILGRGTMESIDRHLEEKSTKRTVNWTTASGIIATISTWINQSPWLLYVAVGAVIVVGGYILWKNRRRVESYAMSFV